MIFAAVAVVVLLVWFVIGRAGRKSPPRGPFDEALERTAARFARVSKSRSQMHFTREKLRRDPATRAVAELGSLGETIDLGCGRGQLAILLLEVGAATKVRGYDWDEPKVALANRAAEGLDARFLGQDASKVDVTPADTVLLIDVLHYLDVAGQDALLARAASWVKPGGRLVVREASAGYGIRSVLTRTVERISQGIRFNLGATIAIRDVQREYVPLLERAGMKCRVTPCWEGTPFGNVLLVAERRSEAEEAESSAPRVRASA
ncbi:hypothetical protein AKJ09_07705 [Labilithrix luteola]|uniref:Methyltransferase domain-containing protein n=1 Tax=Labilithrix luteola TaxID=1391654 RepID=A0A0K1Q5V3_9BACT|nr:class I SAM-dependent methyltransferase [Labilithrix luteola]AKV01042.1 hypothetical protein AKJ09_07705 [Labilithrix luteola]